MEAIPVEEIRSTRMRTATAWAAEVILLALAAGAVVCGVLWLRSVIVDHGTPWWVVVPTLAYPAGWCVRLVGESRRAGRRVADWHRTFVRRVVEQ